MKLEKNEKKNDPEKIGSLKVKDVKVEGSIKTEGKDSESIGDENKEQPVKTEEKTLTDIGDENIAHSTKQPAKTPTPEEHNNALEKYIVDFDKCIIDIRTFRKRIDYIMNIIDLSGIQKEITLDIKSYNPVEHSIVSLIKAKGSLSELLKKMVPSPDLIAFKVYQNYLGLCKEFNEEPTYKESFTELPKEYLNGLVNEVINVLKNNVTAEGNHKNWMDSKLKDGWKFGKIKDADKKLHPSLISYEQLPESERKKGSEFLRIVNEYKNPYTYPKQSAVDIEEVTDKYEVKDLDIVLEEKRYFKGDESVILVSELNRVQLIDFIKSLMAELIAGYVKFNGGPFINYFIRNMISVHMESKLASLLSGITKSSVYTDLIDAKNLFGYTFQYVK